MKHYNDMYHCSEAQKSQTIQKPNRQTKHMPILVRQGVMKTSWAGKYERREQLMKKLLVFLDESGDHSLVKIDPKFPVFALAGVVVKPSGYASIVNKFNKLKLDYFPHEGLILHSREIASREGDFIFLNNDKIRKSFLNAISDAVSSSSFKLVVAVIKKASA